MSFDIENLAAEMTGTVGVREDAALDQALADDIEDFDRQADIRDAHLADDGDQKDALQEDPAAGRRDARVPIGALQEERAKRQQLQQELEAHRQQVAQLQAYQQQVQAFLAQQQAEQIPNFEDDPQGHVEAVKQQFRQELGAVQQQVQLQQFSAQLQSDVAAIAPSVTAAEDAMRAEVGGEVYDQAYRHVHSHVQQDLAQRYPGAGPEMLAQLERVAGVAFVQHCRRQGIDPARHIFEKAQALGFTPGQHVPNSRAPARQPNTSLSNLPASGRAPDQRGRLSAKDIATMPQTEFDALFESMRSDSVQMPR